MILISYLISSQTIVHYNLFYVQKTVVNEKPMLSPHMISCLNLAAILASGQWANEKHS